ncbi:MAG: hypothetical protein WB681_04840 [Candidatus Cybelea sp.]
MFQNLSRRMLIAGAALVFAAGCSSNSPSTGQSSFAPSSHRVANGMRTLLGPMVSGPIVVSAIPRQPNAPRGWPLRKKRRKEILFVADGSSGVLLYNPKSANSSPDGSITTGVNAPAGVAVDKKSTLYVTNEGNSTVTVYPKGKSSPSLTISSGISSPYGVAVDSKGNVFVSNLGTNEITAYAAASTTPYETINFNSYGQAVGVGVDAKDNIWVACDSTNGVFEIAAGTTTVTNSGLTSLNGPIGVSFGHQDQIFVSNFAASDVNIYTYGTTTPSGTITSGIENFGPTLNGFTGVDAFFQSNQADNVVGYKKGQTSPFSTLTGASSPLGIASSPLVTK